MTTARIALRKHDKPWPRRSASWGSLRPTGIRVHYEDEDGREEVEECPSIRKAFGVARGWMGTNETIPTQAEMDTVWIEVEAQDERSGVHIRFYIGSDDPGQFYFQVDVADAVFRRYASAELSKERDSADRRQRAYEALFEANTGELEELAKHLARVRAKAKGR